MKRVRHLVVLPLIALLGLVAAAQAPQSRAAGGKFYFPSRDKWETRKPADVGMDAAALDEAIAFAQATRRAPWGKTDYTRTRSGHSAGRSASAGVARRHERPDRPPRLHRRRVRRHDVRRSDLQRRQELPVDGRSAWRSTAA